MNISTYQIFSVPTQTQVPYLILLVPNLVCGWSCFEDFINE